MLDFGFDNSQPISIAPKDKALGIYARLINLDLPELLLEKVYKQTKWSTSGVGLVAEEYLRFLALGSISDRVVPSIAVDEIWHIHLTFTKHYWKEVCPILGKEFHHDPSGLVATEQDKIDYEKTLKLYREVFAEEPPIEVWGHHSFEDLKKSF